jgi:quinol monooxygenase YgiN
MLETLRFYALEQLDDADVWRRRHAAHYARFAEAAGQAVTGPDEVRWRWRIRSELDNLRAAVSWGLGSDDSDAVLAIRIVAALGRESYLDRSAGIGAWAERASAQTPGVSPGLRSAVLAAAAQDALRRDDLRSARVFAVRAAREGLPTDCPTPGAGHMALAVLKAYSGDPDEFVEALRLVARTSRALEAAGCDLYTRASLRTRTAMLESWANVPSARAHADEAVDLARRLGNPSALTEALYVWSWAHSDDKPAALAALEESVALTRAGASEVVFDGALAYAAKLRAETDERVEAVALLREAIAHSCRIGYRRAALFALSCAVEVLLHLGRPHAAAVVSGYTPVQLITGPLPRRAVRTALGLDESERAAARGNEMTFDELVTFTLRQLDEIGPSLER